MSQAFWDSNAESWRQAIQARLVESRKVTNPALIQEILARRPRSVLDLGCGEGWIASQLPGIEYTGLDFSPKLIEIARRSYPQATFEALSYEELIADKWRTAGLYDLVVFNFSLFDENIQPLLRKASSLLSRSGAIVIQTLHPCFALTPYADGQRTEDFKSFPVPFDGVMSWYGRTLGSWIQAFAESGLHVEKISEPLNPATRTPLSVLFSLRPAGHG